MSLRERHRLVGDVTCRRALACRPSTMSSTVSDGSTASIGAATPETMGAAKLVSS